MGASAGALETLYAILPELPADYPIPIMIVVHLPPDRKTIMAELLQARCAMPIREAEDKDMIQKGTVYLAPPDYHLLVEKNGSLSLSSEEPVLFSRPSIDVLFETAADAYGEDLVGVILTGANHDGSAGLQAVITAGGTGIVQHPNQAYAATMPEAALKINPTAQAMSLDEITQYLHKMGH
ncbi:MAG TPA: chemotaxis protein CheB [Alphaproteobacteria bacterium]